MKKEKEGEEPKYSWTGMLIGFLIFILVIAYAFISGSIPNYKSLYEEQLFEDTIKSAVDNATINIVEQVVVIIINQAVTCEPVSLKYQNKTYELIWMECLDDN